MLARKGIIARPSIAQPRIARKRQSSLILLFKQNPKHYTMKRKCVLAQTFSRSRQCRVRAAGTVGGKAPGGCKAASDEGNYTTKQKCLLARAFLLCRRMSHRAALRAARAAACRRYLPYGKYHGNIIPRSENVCLHRHFREAVNVTSCGAPCRTGGGTPPILAIRQVSCEHYTTLIQ